MRSNYFLLFVLLSLYACQSLNNQQEVLVATKEELNTAIREASPGSRIIMKEGTWSHTQIHFYGIGTEKKPITLAAQTPGGVVLEGQSYVHLGGEHLVVEGLYFKNGYSPKSGVIRFQIGKDSTAFNSRVTQTVIEGFTKPNRWENDRWVELYGQNNRFDYNYLAGKSNDGATLMVYHHGNKHTNSHHQIVNNHFGPRPRKGGPRAETMRLGGSETSMTPGRVNVAHNFFDRCNGEVEIISDKTNYNQFVNNIFFKCEGSLVMRHSDYTTVDGNMFIGGDDSDFYGGIRLINTGHWVTNNYFYKIRGEEFRSPLAVMNGIPKSSLNRYKQVTDAVVAYNTWVDCKSPFQIGVGQNIESKDVLPKSEIRSAPPIRTLLVNNIIYNTKDDPYPLVNHHDISGIQFENNALFNNGGSNNSPGAFTSSNIQMKQVNDWLFVPSDTDNVELNQTYQGFGFDRIKKDLLGNDRIKQNRIGAIVRFKEAKNFVINKSHYGPSWFSPEGGRIPPTVHKISAKKGALQSALKKAISGDVIELSQGDYRFDVSLQINKSITIKKSSEMDKVNLYYSGLEGTPAFQMHPHGRLQLEGIQLYGTKKQLAFAPLKQNMSAAYKLFIYNSAITNFDHLLLASRGSFADSIGIRNTVFKNSNNGFVLAADQKGDYNAEIFTIKDSVFQNIAQNVIHFYRGGYDESTIGGVLTLLNNTFERSGNREKSGILLKTRGIINVLLANNVFRNNSVQRVAVLWGAKNNHEKNNTLKNSGKIEVQQQQALEILY